MNDQELLEIGDAIKEIKEFNKKNNIKFLEIEFKNEKDQILWILYQTNRIKLRIKLEDASCPGRFEKDRLRFSVLNIKFSRLLIQLNKNKEVI